MRSINILSKLRRLFVTTLLVLMISLGILITLAVAIELPPLGSVALIQTTGPNAALGIGDWYTNAGQGNRPHNFNIFVPCTVPPTEVITVEIYDPEIFAASPAPDEIRGASDDTTFTLLAPDNTVIATQTFNPLAATHDQFVVLSTFTTGAFGCGTYALLASTSDDDDNAWGLRITPDDPDTTAGSGDEIYVASSETSYQHAIAGCQDFYFFVPVMPSIRLNNFDMDNRTSVNYFPPTGGSIAGTLSRNARWNNGGGAGHPPPGGDTINNPEPGWWRAEICIPVNNQYIFEPEGLSSFFEQPLFPEMTVSKDDGQSLVAAGQTITYTISYANIGSGAALNAGLTDVMPLSTTFVSCSGGLSCAEASPGVVTYSLGTVPAGAGGQVFLTIQLDSNFPASSTLTNTVQLDYEDTMGNSYPPVEATDVNQTDAGIGPDLSINKTDGGVSTSPGGVVIYTLNYANTSATGATGVVVTDPVPVNTTFNAAASAPTVWSCADGSPAGTNCTTTIGAVGGNSGGAVTFAVTVDSPLPPGVTQIGNTATIADDGTNGPDPTPGNNSSSDTTPVTLTVPPELELTKRDDGNPTGPGETIIYTLNYANTSATGATGVVITDPVPANTTFNATASAPTVWSCADGSPADTDCTTTIGALPGNTNGTVTFAVTVDSPVPSGVTQIGNSAMIADDGANGAEANLANNADTANTPLRLPSPDDDEDDDDDGDDDAGAPPPPPPTVSAPALAPSPPVEPTPPLPVTLLPETGSREFQVGPVLSHTGLRLVLVLGLGVIVSLLYLGQRSRVKNWLRRLRD